jgi:hypothetical protein
MVQVGGDNCMRRFKSFGAINEMESQKQVSIIAPNTVNQDSSFDFAESSQHNLFSNNQEQVEPDIAFLEGILAIKNNSAQNAKGKENLVDKIILQGPNSTSKHRERINNESLIGTV